MKFIDTNGLLVLQNRLLDEQFVISSKSLEELEHIKVSANKDQDIKYKARQVVRLLEENEGKYQVVIPDNETFEIIKDFQLEINPDNIIMACAYQYSQNNDIIFYTNDICCKLIARNRFGLRVGEIKNKTCNYKGYKTISIDDTEMAYLYQNLKSNIYDLLINQYLIVQNQQNEVIDKLIWNGEIHKTITYKQINNDFSGKIKPRNIQQELAFDLLQNKNTTIKILTGVYGSGKDYLMTSTAIDLIRQKRYEKIMWVRNNIEVKNSKPIGFLPNGMKDKLLPFAMPMADHVGGKDGLELLIGQGKVEIEHLGFIRGRNIENTIIMCSEAENMTKEHIQLLLSRIGDNSTLWLNGDFRQIDSNIFESNNGLSSIINKLKGNSRFGYVQLQKTERSETAELANLLD
jgi:PhoH-like ATPase